MIILVRLGSCTSDLRGTARDVFVNISANQKQYRPVFSEA